MEARFEVGDRVIVTPRDMSFRYGCDDLKGREGTIQRITTWYGHDDELIVDYHIVVDGREDWCLVFVEHDVQMASPMTNKQALRLLKH